MEEILLAIQKHISEQCVFFQHIDFNEGQLDYYGTEIPLKYPACLIEFSDASFSDLSQGLQSGSTTITFQVATQKLTNSSSKAPEQQKRKTLEILEHCKQLHKKIHNWRPLSNSGKLLRRRMSKQRRDDGILVYTITYSLTISGT